jgi:hypothetical protein
MPPNEKYEFEKGGDPINCGNIAKRIPSKFMPLVTSLYNFENKLN